MTHLAAAERSALCDTLEAVGPQAPTLCDPWTAADLAAHLVVRERRPDAALGIALPALARRTEQVQAGYARRPWPELVALVRSGPPPWSPARLPAVDDATNLLELFVHHEDVLRGGGQRPRRELDPRLQAALWVALRRVGRLYFRRARTGVVVESERGTTLTVRNPTGPGTVLVRGTPGELVLAAHGRLRAADVQLQGSDEALAAFRASPLGPT